MDSSIDLLVKLSSREEVNIVPVMKLNLTIECVAIE